MHEITHAIRAAYQTTNRAAPRRQHLGASAIGGECPRAVWYGWRWALAIDWSGRMLRLFNRGSREEPWIIDDLRRIGAEVIDVDPSTGKQWRNADASLGEHFSGSMDGAARNLPGVDGWALLEFKTSSTKAFKRMVKAGVEKTKPTHYAQMQVYMGWEGLPRAVYVMICKETDDHHVEVVEFDARVFELMTKRARMILESTVPPAKIAESIESFACRWCDAKHICHENIVADVNCRTCVHSTAVLDEPGAKWRCEHTGEYLDSKAQQRGCEDHLFIPQLVPHSEPIDSGDGWVKYRVHNTETVFLNVASVSFPALDEDHVYLSSLALKAVQPMDFDGVPSLRELRGIAKEER